MSTESKFPTNDKSRHSKRIRRINGTKKWMASKDSRGLAADGFVFPIDVLSPTEAGEHRRLLEAAEAEHGPMHYRVKPYLLLKAAWDLATHPRLLDAVEEAIGPDILLWDCSYIIKEPRNEAFVSWHQDLTYWGLDLESDDDLVSAWVAISPTNQANGALQFVRGSHKQRFVHEDTYAEGNLLHRGQAIKDVSGDIALLELAAGQASLHHGWTVHASGPNGTDDRRVGIVMNYVKPSAKQAVGEYETATLVRGQDHYNNFKAEPAYSSDFAPGNVAFQKEVEQRKREVYDTA